MSLPILQPSTYKTTHVRGDVIVDSSAMIAMGVILNATPGNKIVVHGGVCVGMGTVITACDGDIEIKPNAILGAGCLVFGRCIIGSQASLGASVTIYNTNVDAGDVIPAGSIRGDRTRQVKLDSQEEGDCQSNSQLTAQSSGNTSSGKENPPEIANSQETEDSQDSFISQKIQAEKDDHKPNQDEQSTSEEELKEDVWQGETTPRGDRVVGKVYINKLLFTLFPERKM